MRQFGKAAYFMPSVQQEMTSFLLLIFPLPFTATFESGFGIRRLTAQSADLIGSLISINLDFFAELSKENVRLWKIEFGEIDVGFQSRRSLKDFWTNELFWRLILRVGAEKLSADLVTQEESSTIPDHRAKCIPCFYHPVEYVLQPAMTKPRNLDLMEELFTIFELEVDIWRLFPRLSIPITAAAAAARSPSCN